MHFRRVYIISFDFYKDCIGDALHKALVVCEMSLQLPSLSALSANQERIKVNDVVIKGNYANFSSAKNGWLIYNSVDHLMIDLFCLSVYKKKINYRALFSLLHKIILFVNDNYACAMTVSPVVIWTIPSYLSRKKKVWNFIFVWVF